MSKTLHFNHRHPISSWPPERWLRRWAAARCGVPGQSPPWRGPRPERQRRARRVRRPRRASIRHRSWNRQLSQTGDWIQLQPVLRPGLQVGSFRQEGLNLAAMCSFSSRQWLAFSTQVLKMPLPRFLSHIFWLQVKLRTNARTRGSSFCAAIPIEHSGTPRSTSVFFHSIVVAIPIFPKLKKPHLIESAIHQFLEGQCDALDV